MKRTAIPWGAVIASVTLVAVLWAADIARADTTFGMSQGDSTTTQQDAKFGRVDVVRVFNTGAPKPWSKMPDRPVVVSFKIPAQSVIHGEWDGFLRNWFRTAPTSHRVWWSYWHEPIGDVAPTAYRQAWAHIVKLERQAGPRNLRSTTIFTKASADDGRWRPFYPGDRWVDVMAWDGKLHTWDKRYIPARTHYANAMRITRAHGKQFALAEYGSVVFGKDYRGRADWMRDTARWLNRNNAAFGCWWPTAFRRNGIVQDHRLNDKPSIDAMRWMLRGAWQR